MAAYDDEGASTVTIPSCARVLVVDDEASVLRLAGRILGKSGCEVVGVSSAERALAELSAGETRFDAVLTDIHLPGLDGVELLARVQQQTPELSVVMMTGDASVASAVAAMKRGAFHYLVKPFASPDEVALVVGRAVERTRLGSRTRLLEQKLQAADRFEELVGRSPAMLDVFALIDSVAPTDASVLVLGESGTGKELVARALHRLSQRRAGRFVAVNCSALTDELLESELFGHVRGAFTGAAASRTGLFEEASGGTLFLDEVGDMSAPMQAKLLRALQEGEIKPVGSNQPRLVDVRVLAATHRDLDAAVERHTFREDLYYRLKVIEIYLPPLRARRMDIALLAAHCISRYAARYHKPVQHLEPAALERLETYAWPGNVRELDNVLQRAVVLARGDSIGLDLVAPSLGGPKQAGALEPSLDGSFIAAREAAVAAFETRYLERLLQAEDGNLAQAARRAGLDKSNLRRIVKRLGLDVSRFRDDDAG